MPWWFTSLHRPPHENGIMGLPFAEKLKKLIDVRNLTQAKVEQLCDLPQARIAKWGRHGKPTLEQLVKLALLLRCPPDWLADDEADWPPPKLDYSLEMPAAESYETHVRKIDESEKAHFSEYMNLIMRNKRKNGRIVFDPVSRVDGLTDRQQSERRQERQTFDHDLRTVRPQQADYDLSPMEKAKFLNLIRTLLGLSFEDAFSALIQYRDSRDGGSLAEHHALQSLLPRQVLSPSPAEPQSSVDRTIAETEELGPPQSNMDRDE